MDRKRVVVTVDGDTFVEVLRDGPEIQAKTESDVVDCGAATVLNTNEILFQGVVSNDPLPTLAIGETNGRFVPDAKREARGKSEIEFRMEVSQGTSGKVRVSVLGTSDTDRITAGVLGLNLNGDGDLDVKTSAMPWLTDLVVNPAGGGDGFRDLVDGGRGADSAVVDGGLDTVRHVP